MALHGCCSLSSTAHSRSASSAWVRLRSLLSRGSVPPSQGLGQSMCALVLRGVCTSWTSGHLPLTPGFMTSARIASPCFTRPKFELGLSSRAPEVSAERVRLSCTLKSRVFSSMHHDVLNVGLSTPHISSSPFAPVVIMLDVFDDSVVHGLLSCRLAAVPELS